MLTQKELREALSYDPLTGVFVWVKPSKHAAHLAGAVAGRTLDSGYVSIRFKGKDHKAHRLAFLYMTGRFPSKTVDHIDRNRSNNRWDNLRDVSMSANHRNRGGRGYYFDQNARKYRVQVNIDGKSTHFGYFTCEVAARNAYKNAIAGLQ